MNPETCTEAGFAAVAIGCAICLAWLILRDVLAEQERKPKPTICPTVPANRLPPHTEP